MNANSKRELERLATAWQTVQQLTQLGPIRNGQELQRLKELADRLADAVGDDEAHPLFSLYDLALQLIESWEDANVHLPTVPPHEVLRHLLEVNRLRQKDLSDIASPALVSDILAGRRAISKRLAKALAERFRIDVAAFV